MMKRGRPFACTPTLCGGLLCGAEGDNAREGPHGTPRLALLRDTLHAQPTTPEAHAQVNEEIEHSREDGHGQLSR
jgi:hypothetical protein